MSHDTGVHVGPSADVTVDNQLPCSHRQQWNQYSQFHLSERRGVAFGQHTCLSAASRLSDIRTRTHLISRFHGDFNLLQELCVRRRCSVSA